MIVIVRYGQYFAPSNKIPMQDDWILIISCLIQVLLRSGPTVTNKDGRLMAYCNKDLNAMLREYLGDPSVHIYTNEEYARFSKVRSNIQSNGNLVL